MKLPVLELILLINNVIGILAMGDIILHRNFSPTLIVIVFITATIDFAILTYWRWERRAKAA